MTLLDRVATLLRERQAPQALIGAAARDAWARVRSQ